MHEIYTLGSERREVEAVYYKVDELSLQFSISLVFEFNSRCWKADINYDDIASTCWLQVVFINMPLQNIEGDGDEGKFLSR